MPCPTVNYYMAKGLSISSIKAPQILKNMEGGKDTQKRFFRVMAISYTKKRGRELIFSDV